MSNNTSNLRTSSRSAFNEAVQAAQAAMDNLIAQEELLAEEKRAELDAADARHQERLARTENATRPRAKHATPVESLIIDSICRSNTTERKKFETAFKAMRNVQLALKNCQNDAELLYKLLSIKEDPTSDIIAALEGLRKVLNSPIAEDVAFTPEERSLLLRTEEHGKFDRSV